MTFVVLLAFVNLPATLAFSVNVNVLPATTVPLSALNVIVGVAFPILHVNVLLAVVLSLQRYPSLRIAVIV